MNGTCSREYPTKWELPTAGVASEAPQSPELGTQRQT